MGELSNLKESHPIWLAEYAVAQRTEHEPTFNYGFHILKKDRIIALVKQQNARHQKKSH